MVDLKIIYEGEDILVIDKPAGLVVHPTALSAASGTLSVPAKVNTLTDILLTRYPQIKNVGESSLRPGIVHRLDKNTSGVMIVAKNNSAFQFIKKQFQERKVIKKYLGLAVGRPPKAKGVIETYLSRAKGKARQKASLLPLGRGKLRQATTTYKVIKKYRDYTLLELQPKTGRLHQIRSQLHWLGCPIAGDEKYKRKRQPCPPGLERQFLHATFLKLRLPSGPMKEFKSPLPLKLRNVLRGLQKN